MYLSVILSALIATAAAIDTISVKGSKFFTSSGKQFFVKGIAYQLVPEDPLVDGDQCGRDASLMKKIGANSIRVYHVDATANHDKCMKTFADAGIYLWLDLDTFDTQIEQNDPHWNQTQYDRFQKVMDAFHQYDNTAGFFIGNEVITQGNGSLSAPFVKAATRDMKVYRDGKGYRKIPVGYSAADIATLRPMLQNYLACGANFTESIDFYSLNAYEWCGQTTYEQSGYSALTKFITDVNYNVPIFFSETGCQTAPPRTFDDQAAILGPQMSDHWSGAIIYEWIQEANHYGLIEYGSKVEPGPSAPDGFIRSGTPTPIKPDFDNLSKQWATLNPTGVKQADYNPGSLTPPPCPSRVPGTWEVAATAPIPALGASLNPSLAASISGGPSPQQTGSGGNGGSKGPSGASASATATTAGAPRATAAPGVQQVRGMGIGLVGVLVGVFWWL